MPCVQHFYKRSQSKSANDHHDLHQVIYKLKDRYLLIYREGIVEGKEKKNMISSRRYNNELKAWLVAMHRVRSPASSPKGLSRWGRETCRRQNNSSKGLSTVLAHTCPMTLNRCGEFMDLSKRQPLISDPSSVPQSCPVPSS